MSDRNLKLRVAFEAIDKLSGTVGTINTSAKAMARELTGSRKQLKQLQDAAGDISSFRKLKQEVEAGDRAIKEKQADLGKLARKLRETEKPTKQLTREFDRLKKETARSRGKVDRQREALHRLRTKMQEAGASSGNLVEHEKRLRDQIARTNNQIERQQRAMKLRNKRMEMGGKIRGAGYATSAVGAGVGYLGKEAAQAAIEAQELQSAFNQTFGKSAADLNVWAVQMGDSLGRSTQEMQRGAQAFGLFFNQVDPSRAADMSKEFAVLAQDLESFHNLEPGSGIEKLRAGLSGEAEPLKALGIMLNETMVKAKAAELGLKGVGGKLSEEQKIMARYALIMEKTANAQGDIGRTSDSAANRLREAMGEYEEAQVGLGQELIPVIADLAKMAAGALKWFNQLSPGVKKAAVIFGALVVVLGPLLILIGTLVSAFGFIAAGIAAVTAPAWGMIALIAALVVGLGVLAYQIYSKWDDIKAYLASFPDWLKSLGGNAIAALLASINPMALGLHLYSLARQGIEAIRSYLPDSLKSLGMMALEGLLAAINPMALAVRLVDVAKNGVTAFKNYFGIKSPSRLMMEMGSHVTQGFASGLGDGAKQPIRAMRKMAGQVVTAGAISVAPALSPHAVQAQSAIGTTTSPGRDARESSITINIYQQAGQDARALAREVRRELERLDAHRARGSYQDDI